MADAPDLPPDQDAADEAARAVYADGAAEVAHESAAAESELAKTYEKASSDVRALIRQQGEGATRATVANDVERVLDGALLARTRTIAATIRTANVKGVERAKRTFDVVYGDQRTRAQIHLRPKALEEAADRIAGRTTVDGVGLTKRIKRHDAETVKSIAREVDDIFRGTKGALDAADKIAKIEGAVPVKLAAYQQEMVDAVKQLDSLTWSSEKARKSAVKQAVSKHLKYIESLGEMQPDGTRRASAYSLRGSSKHFAQQLQTARGADIDRVVEKQLEERALWRARVIARHEANLAYDAAYIEQTKDKPGVIGYRWGLSGRHPRKDECDCFSAANYDGLGPGVYRAENLPTKHPMCLAPGTLIETARGHVPIESVRIGDMVRTHSGNIRRVLRLSTSRFVGDAVKVTVGDRVLVATPEHPLLVGGQWVRADHVRKGDQVFVRVDSEHAPTEAGQVGILGDVERPLSLGLVPPSGVDLNGELERVNGHVDAVATERALVGDGVPCGGKRVAGGSLVVAYAWVLLPVLSGCKHALKRVVAPAPRVMRELRSAVEFFLRSASVVEQLDLAVSAQGNAVALQQTRDCRSRQTEPLREAKHAGAGLCISGNDGRLDGGDTLERGVWLAPVMQRIRDACFRLVRHVTPRERGHLVARPELYAFRKDPLSDGGSIGGKRLREPANRHPRSVHLRHSGPIQVGAPVVLASASHFSPAIVDSVERVAYDGHVHNFAVDVDESYVASQIVTHNCICTLSAVMDLKVHDRPEGLPKVPEEFRDNVSPGPESWYRQNPGPAVAILGERRYTLMQQGVTVIDQHGTPLRFADIFGAAKAAE